MRYLRYILLVVFLLPMVAFAEDIGNTLIGFFDPTKPVIVLAPPPPGIPPHNSHFLTQESTLTTMRQLSTALVSQLGTFPVTSSAGSFTFSFDPSSGTFNRSSDTFGPTYAERNQTNGKGKLSIGYALQYINFDSIDGYNFKNGEIKNYLVHDPQQPAPIPIWFKQDIIETRLFLDIKTTFMSAFVNYGLTNNIDVGIAVPYVTTELNATIKASIDALSGIYIPVHTWTDPKTGYFTRDNQFSRGGKASGLGDIVLRAKYRFESESNKRFGIGLDFRLPTGDEDNLLGTGSYLVKPYFIASGLYGKLNYHGNFGFTMPFGGSNTVGDMPKEADYTVGVDASLHPKVSLSLDVIGRYIFDTFRMTTETREFDYWFPLYTEFDPVLGTFVGKPENPELVEHTTREESVVRKVNSNQLLGTFGVKFNVISNFVLSANTFIPIGHNGLHHDFAFTLAGDYTF